MSEAQSHSHGGAAVMCGSSIYDADTLAATYFFAAAPLAGAGPKAWVIDEALVRPMTHAELEPLFRDLAGLEHQGEARHVTYPRRAATVCLFLYQRGPWSLRCRKGVAWKNLITGLHWHHFEPVCESIVALDLLEPSIEFFEYYPTVDELTRLIESVYRFTGVARP